MIKSFNTIGRLVTNHAKHMQIEGGHGRVGIIGVVKFSNSSRFGSSARTHSQAPGDASSPRAAV